MRRSRSHLATVVRPVGHNGSRDEERESIELSLGRTSSEEKQGNPRQCGASSRSLMLRDGRPWFRPE
ncbi:unnamed protein product [Lasius platythorax]|uniref:Uncharacterized protein n=1 Tax=Lasius platythorax TaxID=488582 RepID=A0AAV2NZ69_9HYME